MTQGARVKINRPFTSQVVVQLIDVLDEDREKLKCKESIEQANSVEEILEIAEQFQDSPQWLMKCYQPEVYFASEIEDKSKEKFMEVITLSLTNGAAFPVAVTGVNCNALIDTSATRSCISEIFYNQLMLPWLLKTFFWCNFCLW